MKVLHIIGSMDPASGGPCQGIRNSIKALGSQIVSREVVSMDDPAAPFLGTDDFTIHALGPGKGPWQYSKKLSGWLDDHLHRFDAVIINGLWLSHSYIVTKAVRRFKKQLEKKGLPCNLKVFIMPHGMLDPYFQHAPDRKLKAIRNWAYWKLVEGNVVNAADALLFTCSTELRLARQPFRPYHPKREINVGYGIEAPPSYTAAMQQAFEQRCAEIAGKPYLLFLSRIHPKKGLDLLLEAYAALTREFEGNGKHLPQLVVAGPGLDTAYGMQMKTLVAQNPLLDSHVSFPGMLTGDAKWGAFYGCEAFVLPSHQENFGIAVVEALACKKPVLISNQVNIWEEIQGEGGGIVADNTINGTYNLLKKWIIQDAQERCAMSEKAYYAFLKHFENSKVAHRFFEAIQLK